MKSMVNSLAVLKGFSKFKCFWCKKAKNLLKNSIMLMGQFRNIELLADPVVAKTFQRALLMVCYIVITISLEARKNRFNIYDTVNLNLSEIVDNCNNLKCHNLRVCYI